MQTMKTIDMRFICMICFLLTLSQFSLYAGQDNTGIPESFLNKSDGLALLQAEKILQLYDGGRFNIDYSHEIRIAEDVGLFLQQRWMG